MSNSRIKDLSSGSPTASTYVPGDSTGTGTIKATITTWMVAGWAAAAALLANAAIAAQGVWTFANNVVLSQGLSVAGATTSASLAATGAVTGASVAATGAVTGATVTTTGLVSAGGGVDFTGDKGLNCADPTSAQDVATKAYVDRLGTRYISAVITTTDATPTTALTVTPTDGYYYQLRAGTIFGKAGGPKLGSHVANFVAAKEGGSTLIQGIAFGDSSNVNAALAGTNITIAASGGDFVFQVIGLAATTIYWRVFLEVSISVPGPA